MGTAGAYVVAGLAITLYVAWLAARQQRLAGRIEDLQAAVEERKPQEGVRSKAA